MLKKLNISGKALRLSLIFGLISAIFLSFADFSAGCEDLRQNVLRLHIIANSDSAADQALKLKIRDRIIESSPDIFASSEEVDDAIAVAQNNLPYFEKIANEVIAEENFDYTASVSLAECYFETRVYDDFTLPAGNYESLIITLGKGEGKNWWCVIFPEICLPAASKASLDDTVNDKGTKIAEEPNRYILRFRVVEIYEQIKNWLK